MSEDTSVAVEKKISKSEAVRQAVAQLGVGADSALIRQKAIDVYGSDIDMRTVCQMKSNIKNGRDNKEAAPRKVKLRSTKTVKKTPAPAKAKAVSAKNSKDDISSLVKKLEMVRQCVQEVGDKETLLSLLKFVA
jgi:hypothetical protein